MIGIYKITSPSNKIYIGQSVNIERRFKWHKKHTVKTNSKLSNSFKKYGAENHLFEVLEECSLDDLNIRERHYQEYYNVLSNGLNLRLTKTSDRSGYFSTEVKYKLSEMRKGKKHSVDRKLKNSMSKIGVKHSEDRVLANRLGQLGSKQSDETKLKRKSILLDLYKNDDIRFACGKLLLNTETGIYYFGLVPASESINMKRSTLSAKINGRVKNNTPFIRV